MSNIFGPDALDPCLLERLVGCLDASGQTHRTARILDHKALEVQRRTIDRGEADAEVIRQPAQKQPRQAALAQVARQPGRREMVVLEKRRVGIDIHAKALAQDQLGVWDREPRMQRGARGALHAVIRPERLRAIRRCDRAHMAAARDARWQTRCASADASPA